jgi:hypothetical protein
MTAESQYVAVLTSADDILSIHACSVSVAALLFYSMACPVPDIPSKYTNEYLKAHESSLFSAIAEFSKENI